MPSRKRRPVQPWDQQLRESARAYSGFRLYLDQGHERSHSKVAAALGVHRSLVSRWAQRWLWTERVKAWEDHMREVEEAAYMKAAEEKAAQWAERRQAIRDKEWELGQKLITRAEQMLGFPLVTTKIQDGATTVAPAKWMAQDIPRFLELADKLIRLAAEMESDTQKVELKVKNELEEIYAKLQKALPPAQFQRILEIIAGVEPEPAISLADWQELPPLPPPDPDPEDDEEA